MKLEKKQFIIAGILSIAVFWIFTNTTKAEVYTIRDWDEAFNQGTMSAASWSTTSTFYNNFETTSTLFSATSTEINIDVAITSGLSSDAVNSVSCTGGAGNFTRIGHAQTSGNRWLSVWDIHITATSSCTNITITNSSSEFTGAVWSIHGHTSGLGNFTTGTGTDIGATSTLSLIKGGSALIQIGQWYPTPGGNPYTVQCSYNGIALGECQNTNQFDAIQSPGNVLIGDNTQNRHNTQVHLNSGNNSVNTTYNSGSDPYALVAFVLEDGIGNSDSLSFITPPPNSTIAGDFSSYQLSFQNNGLGLNQFPCASGYSEAQFLVILDTSSSLTYHPQISSNTGQCYPQGTNTIYIPKTFALNSNTTYYAKAYIVGRSDINTGLITFGTGALSYSQNTNPPLIVPPGLATSTNATSSIFFVDCSGYSNTSVFSSSALAAIICYGQKATYGLVGFLFDPYFLFTPIVNAFQDSANQFIQIPPFGIVINQIKSYQDATQTSSTDLSLAITIPQLGINTTFLSTSTLIQALTNPRCDNTCATGIHDTIFTYIRAVIWSATGVSIIYLII